MPSTRVEKVATAEALLDWLRPTHTIWQPRPDRWVFRGQHDSSFELIPSAHRAERWKPFANVGETPFDPTAATSSHEVQAEKELELLRRYLTALDRAGLAVPDEPGVREFLDQPGSTSGFLHMKPVLNFAAFAQHHGIPTRLLDWTRVANNAAYFAASEAVSKDTNEGELTIWALSVAFAEFVRRCSEDGKLRAGVPDLRLFTAPRSSNPNLHAQAGLFTFWRTPNVVSLEKAVQQILSALERKDEPWTEQVMMRFDMPRTQAPKLLRKLSYENVDASHLFPNQGGVVRAIKERALWDQRE